MSKHFLVVIVMLIAAASLAQEGTTSPYSFFGIGELKFKGTVENRTMGGIGVFGDSIHLNLQNPAFLSGLRLVNYTVGGSHRYETLSTENQKESASATSLDYVAIGIPMGKFGGSFGLIPYTTVGYQVESLNADATSQFQGTGGLNRAFVALAYQFTPAFSLGAELNYNFGNIENTVVISQEDVQFGTREFNKSDLLGLSFNFGAAYKTMVSENLELSTTFTFTPQTDFTAENTRLRSTVVIRDTDVIPIDEREIVVPDTDFTFPSQWSLGAGIGQPKKWFIAGEFTSQKTSNFTNRSFELDNVVFTDAIKFRVGGFYIPNFNGFGNYWKRVTYRAGFRFEETGINISGTDIDEFGISFGVGLPVGRLFSNVNIGFEYGIRGTKDFGLIQENFFNTFISLSLNDRWFEKRFYE